MSKQADSIGAQSGAEPWIYTRWLDFLVGCGGWSAPLLAIATWLTPAHAHAWGVSFYLLAVAFNYPHFMATIYRAYRTRADFERHRIVTLHVTILMVLTALLLHTSHRLLPWVFTLYICWSPWHYTGQNFGLLMMFVRRSGSAVTPSERRWIRAAFTASYLMLLASFETGGSSDPLVLSLGLPAAVTLPARLVLGAAFLVFTCVAFRRLISKNGLQTLAAPLTLAVTQFLWFVVPTLLELHAAYRVPQTRYSSGILAVLHSAQYLWITSYYQRREARAAGETRWRMDRYFLTLVAGGIALFIPGPWLVSRVLHFDFTTSFLIFTAIVNIHHFVLDGALWKLRDSRIASVLIDQTAKAPVADRTGEKLRDVFIGWRKNKILLSPAFRVSLVILLFLWGGIDQIHFALGTDEGNLSALLRAARMNPYDSLVQERIASAEARAGQGPDEVAALRHAVSINPYDVSLQHASARAMIKSGRYEEAYNLYAKMLVLFPRDPDALVNYGLLAARLNHPAVAIESWEKAEDVDSGQPNPHLYLAEAFDQHGDWAASAREWSEFLQSAAARPDNPNAAATQRISAEIQLADDESRIGKVEAAVSTYQAAIVLAGQTADPKSESLSLVHLADLQESRGDVKSATSSYRRALVLDTKAADPSNEGLDWFNYGQFLRRSGFSDDVAYACVLHAESLLAGVHSPDAETVGKIRRALEKTLGERAGAAKRDLPALLARATDLPADSF